MYVSSVGFGVEKSFAEQFTDGTRTTKANEKKKQKTEKKGGLRFIVFRRGLLLIIIRRVDTQEDRDRPATETSHIRKRRYGRQ